MSYSCGHSKKHHKGQLGCQCKVDLTPAYDGRQRWGLCPCMGTGDGKCVKVTEGKMKVNKDGWTQDNGGNIAPRFILQLI